MTPTGEARTVGTAARTQRPVAGLSLFFFCARARCTGRTWLGRVRTEGRAGPTRWRWGNARALGLGDK